MTNDTTPEGDSEKAETRLFGNVTDTQPVWLNDFTPLKYYSVYDNFLKDVFVKLEKLHDKDQKFIFTLKLIQNIEYDLVFKYILDGASPETEAKVNNIMENFNSIMNDTSRYNLLKYYKGFSDVFGKKPEWLKNAWLPLECEIGWHPIIKYAFQKIEKAREHEPNSLFFLHQIKEKLGSLRIYYGYKGSEDLGKTFEAIIKEAEFEASKTCECCGKQGSLTLNKSRERGHIGNSVKILCEKDMFRLNRSLPRE